MELFALAKPGFTTVSPDREKVASFDREGRLYAYYRDGLTYRRALDSSLQARWHAPSEAATASGAAGGHDPAVPTGRAGGHDAVGGHRPPRQRRWLTRQEAAQVFAEVYELAAQCVAYASRDVRERLETEILRWTPERLLAEEDRFHRVYVPISILPPDQYMSIVLQATQGCTWNRCTFCSFYQDRPFRAKSPEEFAAHVEAVREFLGRGALMRKGIFLADGNALALSQARLEAMFATAKEAFPGHAIYSFIDLYTGERRSVAGWRRLAELGLQRVYIGMETGHDELLRFLNKPGSREELISFVSDLKQAGVQVGLVAMVGVGGAEYREPHAEATVEAISRMPLGPGDLVYLSPFVEHPGSAYAARRAEAQLTPMGEAEIEAELQRLARQVRSLGVNAARYDIREFIY
ncbi:MAG: amino acid ABC transporter substrate-binding protein [Firmicutes bacterium ZCTH02-B6]|nr:MAG: amino acid ABC transporter substrate-binding protein [Firmicutes bacterium ZCTH02-B6]